VERNLKLHKMNYCISVSAKFNDSLFIFVIKQLDAQNFCFTISLFHASTCFDNHVPINRSKLYYTAYGIITLKQVSGLKLLKYNSINLSK